MCSANKEKPTAFAGQLKFLGPGFVLSSFIVGSVELIRPYLTKKSL
jgi:hypothetical protein